MRSSVATVRPRVLAARRRVRRYGDEGFALALAVLVATVLLMMIAAMLLPVVQDTTTARRATSLTENRLVADTVLNELFSEIRLDHDATPNPVLAGRIAPGRNVSDAGTTAGWAMLDTVANRATPCDALRSTCFSYTLAAPSNATTGAQQDYVVAEVTVRSRCQLSATCVLRRYQQRWHRRRFLDFALFTQYETLDPTLYLPADAATVRPTQNCQAPAGVGRLSDPAAPGQRSLACSEVIFASLNAGRDEVNGPIHTNDPQFWVCGTPKFTSVVEATSPQPLRTLGGSCRANPDVATATVRQGPVLDLPASVTRFDLITPVGYRYVGPTTVHLDGTRMTVTATTPASPAATAASQPAPRRGLLYIDGDLTVDGVADGITLVATGDIHIAGDLTGADIGLVAERNIVIAYSPDVRTIQASLLSRTGTIVNDGLRTAAPSGTTPRLAFAGAMIAKFHPVAGLFDPTDGTLVAGMVSTLDYPTPAPNPPYFLEPVQAAWERIDFTEIALGSSSAVAAPGLAGVPARGRVDASAACIAEGPGDGIYLAGCLAPTGP